MNQNQDFSFEPSDVVSQLKVAGLQTYPAFDNVQEELVNNTEEELDERRQMYEYPDGFRGGLVLGDGIASDEAIPDAWKIQVPQNNDLRCRFFLDGSLRTFLVGQFIEPGTATYPSTVAPIQVASIGANIVELLVNGKFQELRKAIISPILVPLMPMLFPVARAAFQSTVPLWNITAQGLPPSTYYLADTIEQQVNASVTQLTQNQLMGFRDFSMLRSRGTAASNREMRELETWMAEQIVQHILGPGEMGEDLLVIDGSLMFPFRVGQRRHDWTRVVGVSKSFGFSPLIYQRNNADTVGVNLLLALQNLRACERTRAFYILNNNQVAWYLRLHDQHLPTRYGGIVKIEITSELVQNHEGFASVEALINAISAAILAIRFPTAPRSNRWDTHLYPVYVAETGLKSSLPSQQQIVNTWKHLF